MSDDTRIFVEVEIKKIKGTDTFRGVVRKHGFEAAVSGAEPRRGAGRRLQVLGPDPYGPRQGRRHLLDQPSE